MSQSLGTARPARSVVLSSEEYTAAQDRVNASQEALTRATKSYAEGTMSLHDKLSKAQRREEWGDMYGKVLEKDIDTGL